MTNPIKLILSFLFLLCLASMPCGYYQLVRFSALVGFSILAYDANKKENKTHVIYYVALALLFQPFFKIALGRTLWNIVDVILALLLTTSVLMESKKAISQFREILCNLRSYFLTNRKKHFLLLPK